MRGWSWLVCAAALTIGCEPEEATDEALDGQVLDCRRALSACAPGFDCVELAGAWQCVPAADGAPDGAPDGLLADMRLADAGADTDPADADVVSVDLGPDSQVAVDAAATADQGEAVDGGQSPDSGSDACHAAEEACDGADNDCDGVADEDLGEVICGRGACAHLVPACPADACQPDLGAEPEVCDGIDNDCDGELDEDFDLAADPVHCGACGNDCPEGVACVDGGCAALRPNLLLCGNVNFDVTHFFVGELNDDSLVVREGCRGNDTVQALLIGGNGAAPFLEAIEANRDYVRGGGRVITSVGQSHLVHGGLLQRESERGQIHAGDATREIIPAVQTTPDDPFWAANVFLPNEGRGWDVGHLHGVVPLGGWAAGNTSLGYVRMGGGWLWLVESNWSQLGPASSDASLLAMAYMIAGQGRQPVCGNGRDDDADGFVDWPEDPGCSRLLDGVEDQACVGAAPDFPRNSTLAAMLPEAGDDFSSACGGVGSPDAVFRYVLPEQTTVEFSVDHPQTEFAPTLSVRRDCRSPMEVACAGDGANPAPAVRLVDAPAGEYYVVVDGFPNQRESWGPAPRAELALPDDPEFFTAGEAIEHPCGWRHGGGGVAECFTRFRLCFRGGCRDVAPFRAGQSNADGQGWAVDVMSELVHANVLRVRVTPRQIRDGDRALMVADRPVGFPEEIESVGEVAFRGRTIRYLVLDQGRADPAGVPLLLMVVPSRPEALAGIEYSTDAAWFTAADVEVPVTLYFAASNLPAEVVAEAIVQTLEDQGLDAPDAPLVGRFRLTISELDE